MKRTYQAPTVTLFIVKTHHIICASSMGFGGNANKNTTVDSRSNSFWDDEDEEY